MDQLSDPYAVYSELLTSAFEKINKHLQNWKHKELHESYMSALEKAKTDRSLNADQYFPILKQALDTKITSIIETVLYYIQKLISHGFMTGNSIDPATSQRLVDSIVESVCNCVRERDDNVQLQVIKTLLTMVTSFNCEIHDKMLLEAFRACYHIHITSNNLVNQTTSKATLTQMLHSLFQKMERASTSFNKEPVDYMIKSLVRLMVDKIELQQIDQDSADTKITNENDIEAGTYGWCTVCRKPAESLCDLTSDPICSDSCKEVNLKNIDSADQCLIGSENERFTDALVVFRSICKLSQKELSNTTPNLTFKSKVLSLELLLTLIDNPGPVFSSHPQFLEVLKGTLCESLLQNSFSYETTTFALTLSIFVALVNNFRSSLKTEIGVFLDQIFIFLLESDNASYQQKLLVIQVFYQIAQNPRVALELFLNYDCDIDEKDVFTRMIDNLGKIAIGKHKGDHQTNPQDLVLRATALETLEKIVVSLVAWIEESPSNTKNDDSHDDSESASDMTSEIPIIALDPYEKAKQLKAIYARAASKFKIKPSSAINYLSQCSLLDSTNKKEIADYLKSSELDKTQLGDYLGEFKQFNLEVLQEYCQLFDFRSCSLVRGLRVFLSSFRLPGEGQKVDRIMQTFAAKFHNDNPNIFSNADAAYVLSFSIMMLQTNLHNPAVTDKMQLHQFIKNNEGTNNGQNFPDDLLEAIYKEVKENPFTLQEDDEARVKLESTGKKKNEIFAKESQLVMKKGQELMRKTKRNNTYHISNDVEHIKTLFEAIWQPLIATFSIVLEEATDPNFWRLSLQGYLACIRIACRFGLNLEVEILVSSLAKSTSLLQTHSTVSDKNVECMKALLEIARYQANFLKKSWIHVLKCLSKLDHLHMISSGVEYNGIVSEMDHTISENVSSKIIPDDIDYVFSASEYMDDDSIIDFVIQLIEVSKAELNSDTSQTFCIKALVNVAHVNMNRIRYVWGRIWNHLKEHFSKAGLHPDISVAIFAIDSLKQLAMKFLQIEEMADFHFQMGFLEAFELIMKNTPSEHVKELVVNCIANLVKMLSQNIKSGWFSIFEIFRLALRGKNEAATQLAFSAIEYVVSTHLSLLSNNMQELVYCLCAFASSGNEQYCLRSMDLIGNCLQETARGTIKGDYWLPLLSEISSKLLAENTNIENKALIILFESLDAMGDVFDSEKWKLIYTGVILPVFDDFEGGLQASKQWISSTCQKILLLFVKLLVDHYSSLKFLIPDFLNLLQTGVCTCQEQIARVCTNAFNQLVTNLPDSLEFSALMLSFLSNCLKGTLPEELLIEPINNELQFDANKCIEKCMIQLHIIASSKIISANLSIFSDESLKELSTTLKESYRFSKGFNCRVDLRQRLWQAGLLKHMKTLPGIFKQEKESLAVYLDILLAIVARDEKSKEELYCLSEEIIAEILDKGKLSKDRADEVLALYPVVAGTLLPGISKDLKTVMKRMGRLIVDLIQVEDQAVREEVRKMLIMAIEFIN
ncbi:unnamed protein product [Blepharisma stoltei]|uniref:SEC7 domain-containing protein n=1 Tax=Blepharisma stoltei TaxID=1481888 RepID=A0AAU9JIG6_9CILI|nr:unnamed protein product [Blepharisma stoltei]